MHRSVKTWLKKVNSMSGLWLRLFGLSLCFSVNHSYSHEFLVPVGMFLEPELRGAASIPLG